MAVDEEELKMHFSSAQWDILQCARTGCKYCKSKKDVGDRSKDVGKVESASAVGKNGRQMAKRIKPRVTE